MATLSELASSNGLPVTKLLNIGLAFGDSLIDVLVELLVVLNLDPGDLVNKSKSGERALEDPASIRIGILAVNVVVHCDNNGNFEGNLQALSYHCSYPPQVRQRMIWP